MSERIVLKPDNEITREANRRIAAYMQAADERRAAMMKDEEVRVVSKTGGAKGSKPVQLGWAPPIALLALGRVYGFGAKKYTPYNFRKGYEWSLSVNAMQRHILAFLQGELNDSESGEPHMAHVAWHALNLIYLQDVHPDLNDVTWDQDPENMEIRFSE